jgi:retron-type reverse transcriptase
MDEMSLELYFRSGLITQSELFRNLFSSDRLQESFETKYYRSSAKGLDRVSGMHFRRDAPLVLEWASKKCLSGNLKFTPYLEVLKPKGRGREPRVIGIPTIRDRVVLGHLHRFISAVFPEAVPAQISGAYVRAITDKLAVAPVGTWICGTDIKTFYDSIERDRLMEILAERIVVGEALALISRALHTPIVPKNTARSSRINFRENTGIPQGLAISNVLASIYMLPVDRPMMKLGVGYIRYVDDVLMHGTEVAVRAAHKSLSARLKRRGLSLHTAASPKTQIQPIGDAFEFLGYRFELPKVTVRDTTVERFLQAIAGRFSDFRNNKASRLLRFAYLTEDRLKDIFLSELNEKITGAISGNKRYGWIAYFSQINDHALLYRIDSTIASMFTRLSDFNHVAPTSLRRIARAFWEIKYRPNGNYILNYDKFETPLTQLQFLVERGRVNPKEILTDEQISVRFQAYVKVVLSDMQRDEGSVY